MKAVRSSLLVPTIVALLLIAFSLSVPQQIDLARAQTSESSTQSCAGTSSTCQQIFPAAIAYSGVAAVQQNPQPPVFGGYVYVSNEGSDTVSVIMGTTNIANVSVGSQPLEPAFDPANGLVYVPNSGGNTVSVLSGSSLEATVTVGQNPVTPAYDPANGYVYVPNSGGCASGSQGPLCEDTVSVISGTSVIATVSVGVAPEEPVVDTNGGEFFGYVYVPNAQVDDSSLGTISIISPQNESVGTLELGPSAPPGAFFDSLNGWIYAGPYVINGTTEVGQLSQGGCTASTCVLDPYNGNIYSPGGSTMFVISGTDSTSFNCQTCGNYATFDPMNGWVYAGWAISGALPFAYFEFSTESSGVHDASSFDPQVGAVYASCGGCYYDTGLGTAQQVEHHGNVAIILGNTCVQLPTGDTYNATLAGICGAGAQQTMTNQTMTVYNGTNGAPEALGGHVFSVLIDSLNLVSGHWNATTPSSAKSSFGKIQFTVTGPSGTMGWATITIPKVLVGLYLFSVLQGQGAPAGLLSQSPPTVFVDGQQEPAYFSSDSNNLYISFHVHFSTDNVTLEFIPLVVSNSTTSGSNGGSSAGTSAQSTSSGPASSASSSITSTGQTTTQSRTAASSTPSSSTSLDASYLLLAGASMATGALALVLGRRKSNRSIRA